MSRLQTLHAKGLSPDLPPMGLAAHLSGYLFEVGPVVQAGMGPAAIGWQDLQAWQANTGIELQAWESRALRRLSFDYLHTAQAAQEADCPAPWSLQPTPDQREHISNALRSIFGSLRKH